ncbi:CGNR zinc finger domain-containing protein [Streptosporangium lutulentum]
MNRLAVTRTHGRTVTPPGTAASRRAALTADRPEAAGMPLTDVDALASAAEVLRSVFGAPDPPVAALNDLLIRHSAVPTLHEDTHTLSFHRQDARLVDAWVADAGTALAMIIGVGQAARLGRCQAGGCDLVFMDITRNASRRFCDLSCQNRAKASAYRARRGSAP